MLHATIIGRIGQAAPYQGPNGQFLRVRVAVPIRQRGGQDHTEWVTVFTTRTELMPYLTNGRQILATGPAQVSVYNGQAGVTLHAFHVELLAESLKGQVASLLPQLLGQAPAQPVQSTMAQAPAQPMMSQAQAQPAVDANSLAQALAAVLGGNRAQPTGAQTQPQAHPDNVAAATSGAPADAVPEAAPF